MNLATRLAATAVVVAAACGVPSGTQLGTGLDTLPPPGFGTLRQDEVTVALSSGPLEVKVTPLAESVIRVTAPDTYRRLSGLASLHLPEAVRQTGLSNPTMFLVSFFSEAPETAFVPEELQIISRGMRLRADAILPVTPGWGQRRLAQRATEMAVYAFAERADLESDLVVAYGLVESGAWNAILPRVQAERARARARGAFE
jgi:hypothetical protein